MARTCFLSCWRGREIVARKPFLAGMRDDRGAPSCLPKKNPDLQRAVHTASHSAGPGDSASQRYSVGHSAGERSQRRSHHQTQRWLCVTVQVTSLTGGSEGYSASQRRSHRGKRSMSVTVLKDRDTACSQVFSTMCGAPAPTVLQGIK
jgi:hypothetical protein